VQTPTLALIVDRELEVLAHVPKPYWRLEAKFQAAGHEYMGSWFDPDFAADEDDRDRKADRLFDENRARQIIDQVQGQPGAARETRKPSREAARPLFDLTSLQREANGRFGWSARRTLRSAQRLYEHHKLLTYPRTDSRALPNDYRATVDEALERLTDIEDYAAIAQKLVDGELQNTDRTFDDSKVSDHFAIIPTGNTPDAELTGDDKRLFDLVTRRFMANFYPPAVWNRVERVTEVAGQSFRSHSKTLEEPGWYEAMGRNEQEDQALPPLVSGATESDGVEAQTLDVEQVDEKTKPLPRITEARLLSLMENAGKDIEDEDLADALHEKGIGTPATRADVIENLIAKSYLLRVGKSLRPTVKGIRLIDVLRRVNIDRLASPELTGELEFKLREVEHGRLTRESFMDEIVDYTLAVVERAKTFSYDELYPDEDTLGFCPLCKRPVYERSWFYRCLETPDDDEDCPFRIWKDKSGRYMDRATVQLLLEKGETGEVQDFTWRNGRTYNGILRIEDHELKLDPIKGSGGEIASDIPEYDVDERPLGACPLDCGSEVIETSTLFRCKAGLAKENELAAEAAAHKERTGKSLRRSKEEKERNKACPWAMPRTVCKREIMRDEAEYYMRHGRTELLQDFTSQYGRPFVATLVLNPDTGRHGFEFQPRKKAEAGGAKKGTRKKTTRKKATRKKTTRKKVSARKTGGRKAARKTAKSPRKKAVRKKG
jgi:DNA topoisomerase-3